MRATKPRQPNFHINWSIRLPWIFVVAVDILEIWNETASFPPLSFGMYDVRYSNRYQFISLVACCFHISFIDPKKQTQNTWNQNRNWIVIVDAKLSNSCNMVYGTVLLYIYCRLRKTFHPQALKFQWFPSILYMWW